MTGIQALVRSHISASHDFHSGGVCSGEGFGRRAVFSEGWVPSGVTVVDEELLGIFLIFFFALLEGAAVFSQSFPLVGWPF